MRTRINRPSTDQAEPMPDALPWHEVGWIFRDGGVLAVERQGTRTRVRSDAVLHQRDE
jgi:hypothetical protein